MTNVKRLTVIALCMASCMGVAAQNGTSTQIPGSSEQPADSLPAQWDLQACIDYALQQNITIRKNRLNAESAQVSEKSSAAAREKMIMKCLKNVWKKLDWTKKTISFT